MKRNLINAILLLASGLATISAGAQTTITVKPGNNALQKAINKAAGIKGNVVIELSQGTYRTSRTIEVTQAQWSSLLITSRQGHQVSITGDVVVPKSRLRHVTNKALLERIPAETRSQVMVADCRGLVDSLANIRPSGFGRKSMPAWSELMVDGSPLTIARWPNDSMALIGKIEVSGGVDDKKAGRLPVFHYHGDRPKRWKDTSNMWIGGYFGYGYADDLIPVKAVSTADSTIHAAMFTTYQFFTGADFRRWYAANIIEELDREGEFVIDPKQSAFYFIPPVGTTRDVRLTVLQDPILAIEHCSNVTVKGITFENSRGIGVYIEDTHNVVLDGCTLRNLGSVAVSMGRGTDSEEQDLLHHSMEHGGKAHSRLVGDLGGTVYQNTLFYRNPGTNNGVRNCYIYNVGGGGVSLGGGDRKTLTPSHNYVENCRISQYNRIEKSYRPAVWIDGVGNRVSSCSIFNAPSMAILFHGNDHVIELCDITNVCQEVDDQGAIYYGRDPSEQGHIIRYNYFHQLSPRHRVTATYHDDGACGSEVYGNIYHRAGSLPVLIGGGTDHHYHGNLFLNCPVAIHVDNRLQNWAANMVAKDGIYETRLNAVDFKNPPYSTAYPKLVNYWDENPALPKRNLIEGNLFYNIDTVIRGNAKWGEWRGNWTTVDNPGFVDPEQPLKGFVPNAPILKVLPEAANIPFDKIGSTLPAAER
ncbi:MAG: right-handed parallel beta-helix repeat-containing protein [Muribaculaceae bacterium]